MEISRIKLTLFAILCQLFLSDAVEVTTPRGKIVGSENLKTRNGRKIFSFSGIPFAKPPVGTLRFKEPQPLGPWKEPLDATKDGPECPQIPNPEVNPSQLITGKEDCLNLNVYSPKVDAKAKLPVMFYIHGGGYQQGSGHRSLYGPEFLLDRDIVLVTANYRLAILGFATTGDDSIPGNLGLKDQSFALKWVHDNIEHFGGDPNLVTVFGESAGGASTHLSILSPLNKVSYEHKILGYRLISTITTCVIPRTIASIRREVGMIECHGGDTPIRDRLVHRGISMSGTALCTWAVAPLQLIKDRTKAVATITGCPTEPSDELLKCLQEVPLDVLVLAPRKFQDWLVTPAVVFGPVIEPETAKGAYLTADPSQIESKTPWITGISSGEGGLFASLLSTAGTGGKFEAVLKEEPQYILPKLLMLRMILAKNDVPAVSKRIQKFYFGERTIGKNTTQEIIDMVTDGWFLNGALDAVARHSGDTWLYYYDYMQSVSYNQVFGKGDIKSVCHSDILLNLFKIPQLFPKRTESEKDIKESEKILDLWTNFAKYGKPTENSALKWEPAGKGSAASKKYLYIGEEVVPKENLLPERVEFWNTVNEIGLRKKSV